MNTPLDQLAFYRVDRNEGSTSERWEKAQNREDIIQADDVIFANSLEDAEDQLTARYPSTEGTYRVKADSYGNRFTVYDAPQILDLETVTQDTAPSIAQKLKEAAIEHGSVGIDGTKMSQLIRYGAFEKQHHNENSMITLLSDSYIFKCEPYGGKGVLSYDHARYKRVVSARDRGRKKVEKNNKVHTRKKTKNPNMQMMYDLRRRLIGLLRREPGIGLFYWRGLYGRRSLEKVCQEDRRLVEVCERMGLRIFQKENIAFRRDFVPKDFFEVMLTSINAMKKHYDCHVQHMGKWVEKECKKRYPSMLKKARKAARKAKKKKTKKKKAA